MSGLWSGREWTATVGLSKKPAGFGIRATFVVFYYCYFTYIHFIQTLIYLFIYLLTLIYLSFPFSLSLCTYTSSQFS